ncbi:hypothetical protein glysoja_027703 [Glycine soja]|uniref:Uncharacterized protein n=1 Tax=Glycine soja TaxID=3848 RepID=A0A0B2SH25_GLYSO|nr:hypothetical protein glysoja_027703 [Glycine soja]
MFERGLASYGFSHCILIDEFCPGKRMKEAMDLFRDLSCNSLILDTVNSYFCY